MVLAIDVATAFDETKHEQLYNAMKKQHVDTRTTLATMHDYADKKVNITIDDVTMEGLEVSKGG